MTLQCCHGHIETQCIVYSVHCRQNINAKKTPISLIVVLSWVEGNMINSIGNWEKKSKFVREPLFMFWASFIWYFYKQFPVMRNEKKK